MLADGGVGPQMGALRGRRERLMTLRPIGKDGAVGGDDENDGKETFRPRARQSL